MNGSGASRGHDGRAYKSTIDQTRRTESTARILARRKPRGSFLWPTILAETNLRHRQSSEANITRRAFISHSSPDDRYVQEMVQFVHTLGYDEVFNDSHTIATRRALLGRGSRRASCECDAFVVVLSHASVKSYWVDREVQFAREHGKKVIPVRIDDCKLPPSFDGRDVIDLRQGAVTKSSSPRHASPNIRPRSSSAATNGSMRSMRPGQIRS